jgi:hypothetical protein
LSRSLVFVLPTLVIGYGVVIPNSSIAGVNSQTIGFARRFSAPVSPTWRDPPVLKNSPGT